MNKDYRFETEVKVNRRKYELEFRQKRFVWSGKVADGVIEILVHWKQNRYTESALLEIYQTDNGELKVRNRKGATQFAKSSLKKLKDAIIEIAENNPEEMAKVQATEKGK